MTVFIQPGRLRFIVIFDFHHPFFLTGSNINIGVAQSLVDSTPWREIRVVSLFIYSLDDKEVFMSQKLIPYQKEIVKIPEEI